MHKVVIERPRWNPGPGKQGRRANWPDERLPKFEGIKRPHQWRKGLTDLLGPLRRWLQSQVGRPWNDVYSEACAVIKPDSVIRAHVKTHLLQFVERHTFMHQGEVCVLETGYQGGIVPVTARRYRRSWFYVHPETGILEKINHVPLRALRLASRPILPATVHWLDGLVGLVKFKGLWFACQFQVVPAAGPFNAYDYLVGKQVGRGGLLQRNGNYLHCIARRQLSHRELRQQGLTNSTAEVSPAAQPSAHRPCGALRVGRKLLRAADAGLLELTVGGSNPPSRSGVGSSIG